MSKKSLRILIVAAAVLLVLGICGIAAVLLSDNKASDDGDNTAEPVVTHAPEEYNYNEDGSISSIIYYKDNVYNGRTDYYTDVMKNIDYVMSYDADGNETESERSEHNSNGAVSYYEKIVAGTVVQSVDYDYYSDTTKLKKKTTKEYDSDGTENAEKLYYYENGKVSQRCNYVNGELTSQIFYDEDGNTVTE